MFRGNTTVNLDEKGRFAIPTRYRDRVKESCAGQLVVTVALDEKCVGIDGCLWVYPLPQWEELESKILALSSFNPIATKLKRFLIGSAFECEMDAQGRILLPEKLRKFANLDKKFTLVGQLSRFEVWNEAAWATQEAQFFEVNNEEALKEIGSISF